MKVNEEIRVPSVRVIGPDGEQVGIMPVAQAVKLAEDKSLDLVEIAPNATPPVCKIIDYGKFRYNQTKREKESKKAQHQIKVKEVKLKPNINDHDFEFKMKHARQFLDKGNKVKVTCMFRGREVVHPEVGEEQINKMCKAVEDMAAPESKPQRLGRNLVVVLAPLPNKKKK
ncbi:MAG: translation initiation factor IF-3 [Chlamydiota bacterium]